MDFWSRRDLNKWLKNKKNVNSVGKVVLFSLQKGKIMCGSLRKFVNFVGG